MSFRNGRARGAFPLHARLAMLGLLMLTSCGGSGSSGFDAVSEAAAVMHALEQGGCVVFNGTTYCGSGAPLSIDDGTVSVRIDTAKTPRSCTPRPAAGCPPSVPFVPEGFPEGTIFRAALATTAEGPWTLVPTRPGSPQANDPQVIEIPEPPAQSSLVAVLVYLRGVPDDLPDEAARVADFGADAVYVHDPFEPPSAS